MPKILNMTFCILSLSLAGCGWMSEDESAELAARDYLEVSRGTTDPLWMAAPRPGLSAVGKDFLFVGPMSENRSGRSQEYLWFAVGTTIDRRVTGSPQPVLDSVVLTIDGTPMTFDIVPWDQSTRPTPFELVIESYASYAARITDSQLSMLANAQSLEAYVTDADGRSPTYTVVVGEQQAWRNY